VANFTKLSSSHRTHALVSAWCTSAPSGRADIDGGELR
jgi:hypothetical protein